MFQRTLDVATISPFTTQISCPINKGVRLDNEAITAVGNNTSLSHRHNPLTEYRILRISGWLRASDPKSQAYKFSHVNCGGQ